MNSLINQNNHLLILFLNDSQLQLTITLTQHMYTIGRSVDCEIKLRSSAVSRHHATLIKKVLPTGDSFYVLIDGNLEKQASQNGTIVNGQKISSHQLEDGDVVYFGDQENQAIYKYKKNALNSLKSNSVLSSKVTLNSSQNSNKTTERIQDTLIISEENLVEKLKTQDVEHLASFPELSPNPIIEFDFNGNITYSNPSAKLCFSQLLTQPLSKDNCLLSSLTANCGKSNGELLIREIHYQDKFYEQYIHYLSKQKVIRSYIFDITLRKKTEAKLQYQAFHDSLTGIPNRNYFYDQLQKSLQERKKAEKTLAVLFIDIDRFKNINDTLSHTFGDKLLECFAYRLISVLPKQSFLARWGGDEFVLIAPLELDLLDNNDEHLLKLNDSSKMAATIANRILNSLKKPFLIAQHTIHISCSIGISIYPDNSLEEKQLVKFADIALSKIKQMGKNNYQFYVTQLNPEQALLFELEHSLYSALDNQELLLNFQPKLNLKTNQIMGVEVLLRWNRSGMGFISPNKFIPIAEETGLIIPIGTWVLEKACFQAKKWLDSGYPALNLAVNVSMKQFQTREFVDLVKDILHKTQFPPQYLELEITESLLIENSELAESIISELSLIGVRFSIDDFGTGYSSFSYLKKFPFKYIKIDKSFVDDLAFNVQDKALVSAIITIAQSYNMLVVAEGVETENQRQMLEYLECDIIQGWLISKSLTEKELLAFISKRNTIDI